MKNILSVFVLMLFSVNLAQAGGPWPQPKGKGYFKLSEWWVVFDQHYTDSGKLDPNATTGVFNTSFYGEYGFTNRLTGIINAPLFSRNYMNNIRSNTTQEIIVQGEAINSIGDIDLGLKFGLTKRDAAVPISVSVLLGIPTGKKVGGTLNNLQTGDGEFNQFVKIDAGSGFSIGKTSAYISGYLGLNNRSKEFSEELRLGAEFGVGLMDKKLWLVSKLDVSESFKNGANAETITSTSLFANNSEFASLTLEANFYVAKRLGFSASVASAFRGEIIAAAPSFSIGVFYDMNK